MAENNSSAPLKTAQGEDERALFEAVASDHGLWPKAIERDAKGNYLLLTTANGWMWWQHARSMPTTAPQSQAEVQAEPVSAKFFSFDPADDLVFHETEDDARSAAQKAIDLYRDEAGDGWSEEVKRVCWGRVIQQAAENVLPDNFPANAFSAGAAGSLPSVDYVLTTLYTALQAQPADAMDAKRWRAVAHDPKFKGWGVASMDEYSECQILTGEEANEAIDAAMAAAQEGGNAAAKGNQ